MTSTVTSIGVIIPSRLQKVSSDAQESEYFLERAIASAAAQTAVAENRTSLTFIVGIDADAEIPARLAERPGIVWARSEARSQAGALNAAIAAIAAVADRCEYIAFLEDDDRWDPSYLSWGLRVLKRYGFLSTTQLEVDENDQILRINDFPTPSGWMMPLSTLRQIGCFDRSLRWHLDNDWLGRLAASRITRCHLVDALAPMTVALAEQVRPWMARVAQLGGTHLEIQRHTMLIPLVIRLVHSRSGMARISADPVFARESQDEYAILIQRYGRIPW
jgi:hypothetical protein